MLNLTSSIFQKDESVMRANRKILYVKVYQHGVSDIPAKALHTYLLREFKFRR
jgi:hypothetical protein